MKRRILAAVILAVSLSATAVASPQEKLEISAQQWNVSGSFDYYLHYPNSSKILSQISAPQDQSMTILNAKYMLDKKRFINLKYGGTGFQNKGRGTDSDWTDSNSNSVTYYGDMEFHGKQAMWSFDYGQIIADSRRQKTSVYIGWDEKNTTNELKNVVYHLVNGVNVGDQTQSDNGSTLNGKFSGFHAGINHEVNTNGKLAVKTGLIFSYVDAKAYGHWANHSPAWNWVNSGSALGYAVNAGVEYQFDKGSSAEVGYSYNYMKAKGANETLNDSLVSNEVDLTYKQAGIYFGLKKQF